MQSISNESFATVYLSVQQNRHDGYHINLIKNMLEQCFVNKYHQAFNLDN